MTTQNLEVFYPRYITLSNGKRVLIQKNQLNDEEIFSLLVPTGKIDKLVKNLKSMYGFEDATPSIPKGEDYSISRIILHPWELHLRLYYNSKQPPFGRIQAHFEVSREYFEHLGVVQPVIYEPFDFYKDLFPEFVVLYNPENAFISSIDENYKITLNGPGSLTPWKPVVASVVAVGLFAGILYAISKLAEPKEE